MHAHKTMKISNPLATYMHGFELIMLQNHPIILPGNICIHLRIILKIISEFAKL